MSTEAYDRRMAAVMTKDDGCDLHDHCLTCPREQCIFDEVDGRVEYRRQAIDRNNAIRNAVLVGLTVAEAMIQFGVSRRTVVRAINRRA